MPEASPRPSQEPLVCSYLPAVVDASRMTEFPVAGTPAGTVAVRASGLRFHGGTVTVAGNAPSAGELAVFCRPVVTAPARHGLAAAGPPGPAGGPVLAGGRAAHRG